ncbi:MAG: sugar transferase [Anaerolinea sp.]|nr:sugar transferase [Anaerolinea sp.]
MIPPVLRYNLRYQLFLSFSDVVLVLIALALSSYLRIHIDLGMDAPISTFIPPPLLYAIAAVLFVFAYAQMGVYTTHGGAPLGFKLRRILAGHALATLLFLGMLYIGFRDFSRLQVIYFVAIAFILITLHRTILTALSARILPYINTRRNVIIVAVTDNAQAVGERVRANARAGLNLIGYVAPPALDLPVLAGEILGGIDDLPALVKAHRIDEVIIAVKWFDQQASDLVSHIMRLLEAFNVNIRLAPDYSELAYFRANPEDFDGVSLVGLRESILTPVQRLTKRTFDIVFSLLVLLLTWPLFIIIATAIRLDSPGPAIFSQLRVGQHGRRFIIYKFRTMYVGAEDMINPQDFIKGRDDPRVTRVGRFLRRTSLDELPQFINVLKGEMSVVGPRPEVTTLMHQYEWWQRKRFEVPQGITGWWQVNGRADRPMQQHTEDDLYYVRHYSFWLDMQIIARTALSVFTRKGAY